MHLVQEALTELSLAGAHAHRAFLVTTGDACVGVVQWASLLRREAVPDCESEVVPPEEAQAALGLPLETELTELCAAQTSPQIDPARPVV